MIDTKLTIQNPVKDFVQYDPEGAIKLFQQYRIDYCCGADKSLEEACEELELQADFILEQLYALSATAPEISETDWRLLDAAELVDHIVSTHHEYLERAFPELTELAEKVVQAHGGQHSYLKELQVSIQELIQDLVPHMFKEEKILFPMIKKIESDMDRSMTPRGSVENPIRVMLMEHERAGEILKRIRSLTSNFTPPDDACTAFQRLYALLEEVEEDLHFHIYKETSVLFPLALTSVD